MATPDPLAEAEATEAALRAQLGELISARVRAEKEGGRLADRATVPGADPELSALAERYRAQAGRLATEVEEVRTGLRAQEARTEALRAAPPGPDVRAALTAPYADVRAADLVLALDAPPAPALETLALELGGVRLELRLLGHSHQALVAADDFALSETVSCRPGAADERLPAARALRRDGRAYAFSAEILPLDGLDAEALTASVGADPHGLVGLFGGAPGAFTALRAAAATGPGEHGVRWETWHAYPQSGELVRTTGEVLRA